MEHTGRVIGDEMKAEDLIEKAIEYCDWMRTVGLMSDLHYTKITTYLEIALDALAEEEK